MKELFNRTVNTNLWFFVGYLFFLTAGIFILILMPKGEILLYLNARHTPFFDNFFKFFSNVGDGIYFLYLLLLLGFFSLKYLIQGISMFLGSGAFTQIFKLLFNEPRPKAWFGEEVVLNFVEGIKVHSYNSFPSGHTTAGFAIFLFLALNTKYKPFGLLYLILAILVGMSRIYLVQHFYIDVFFGSILGVFGSLLYYILWEKSTKVTSSNWYNYSLYSKLFKK